MSNQNPHPLKTKERGGSRDLPIKSKEEGDEVRKRGSSEGKGVDWILRERKVRIEVSLRILS